MKYFHLILIPLGLILLSSSCKEEAKAQLLKSNYITDVTLNEFSAKTHIPGIESNIRKTIKYTIDFKGDINEVIKFNSLLIDSVKIPFTGIIVDGESRGRTLNMKPGKYESIQLICNRLIYIPDHPNPMIEEVILEKNVMKIDGNEGYLLYEVGDNFDTMFLGEYEDKGSIAHP